MTTQDPKLTIRGNKWKLKSESETENTLVLQVFDGAEPVEVEISADTADDILQGTR
jgi:hypothetical protein